MVVVKTLAEAKAATNGFTTTYFPFQKKKNTSELHEGHAATINQGRSFGNKTVLGFWYLQAILNHLDPTWATESSLEWDRDNCIAWAEAQNIDIVWAPDYQDEINVYNVSNSAYYRDLTNRIWNNEQYEKHFINLVLSDRAKLICFSRLLFANNWKYIFSWKDGITRYVEADFMHKHTNKRVVILDPVKTPEGLYYSSSYFRYTAEEKIELAKIEPAILASNLSGLDPVGVVGDAVRAAVIDASFVLQGANVTSDERFLGPGKKLVDLNFHIGTGENIKYDHYAFLIE